jgi:hypothetical protein
MSFPIKRMELVWDTLPKLEDGSESTELEKPGNKLKPNKEKVASAVGGTFSKEMPIPEIKPETKEKIAKKPKGGKSEDVNSVVKQKLHKGKTSNQHKSTGHPQSTAQVAIVHNKSTASKTPQLTLKPTAPASTAHSKSAAPATTQPKAPAPVPKKLSNEKILEKLYRREEVAECLERLVTLDITDPPFARFAEIKDALSELSQVVCDEITDLVGKKVMDYSKQHANVPEELTALYKTVESLLEATRSGDYSAEEDLDGFHKEVLECCTAVDKRMTNEVDAIANDSIAEACNQAAEMRMNDPVLQKACLKIFGPYVAKEIKREAAANMTNQLVANMIDLGNGLGVVPGKTIDTQDFEKLLLVQEYERKKNKYFPMTDFSRHKEVSIKQKFTLKSHKNEENDYSVKLTRTSMGQWKATIKDQKTHPPTVSTFTSNGSGGHSDYLKASAWVHAQLDQKFYEKDFTKDLTRIAWDLGIASQTLNMIGNTTDVVRKVTGVVADHVGMVDQITESAGQTDIAKMVGAGADIVGLCMLLPAIMECYKAHETRQEINEANEMVKELTEQREKILDDLEKKCKRMNIGEFKRDAKLIDMKVLFEKKLGKAIKNNSSEIITISGMIDSVEKCLPLEGQIKGHEKNSAELKVKFAEKITTASISATQALVSGSKAGIALSHIGASGTAAAAAALGLGIAIGPLMMVGGAVKGVFDARRLMRLTDKKHGVISTMKKLEEDQTIQKNESLVALLKDIEKMELRNLKKDIGSNAFGVSTDALMIGTGVVALASALHAPGTGGLSLVIVPVLAATALLAKTGYDAGTKLMIDRQQKELLATMPDASDVGIMARLHAALKTGSPEEVRLLKKHLIRGYYDIDPRIFMDVTHGLLEKYSELQKNALASEGTHGASTHASTSSTASTASTSTSSAAKPAKSATSHKPAKPSTSHKPAKSLTESESSSLVGSDDVEDSEGSSSLVESIEQL